MNIFKNNFLRNANESLGQTLMEFALLLLLIACVVILSVALVGKSTSNGFNNATSALSGQDSSQGNGQGNGKGS
ncbi:MAG TPA: hypothetical protein VFG19_13445 [Geobacteraceae bacterium]|nr:hypothetical protein [Geobacteraceae bacterium]